MVDVKIRTIHSKWREFESKAKHAAHRCDPEDSWVAYEHPLKNSRSAQSTATVMRKVLVDLEIKTVQGVIYARARPAASLALPRDVRV